MTGRNFHQQVVVVLAIAAGLFFCMLTPVSNAKQTEPVEATIGHLLDYVNRSTLVFIRNSGEYTAQQASEHMQKKYEHFRDEIETPEQFIELCATRSLLSGKPYLVINKHGETLKTSEWLTAELNAYRNNISGRAR
jgi:Family of unknown function (DUF5329)